MTSIKSTEREVVAWICGELANILKTGGHPFTECTVETSVGGGFPDLILWIDRLSNQAFSFFEIKPPGKVEDISRLPLKASRLGAKYAIVWNFETGALYEIEGGRVNKLKDYNHYILRNLEDWKRRDIQIKIMRAFDGFLMDLQSLYQHGILKKLPPDKLIFIKILRESVEKLSPMLTEHIKLKTKDKKIKQEVESWGRKQGIAKVDEESFYETIGRQWAYSLITRILFYFTIRRHFTNLPELRKDPDDSRTIEEILIEAFKEAQKIDWHAVFETSFIETHGLPDKAENIINDLLKKLKNYNFSQLKEDVIGEIFEELIPPEDRHSLGQYFTREDLVDFIIGFVANDYDGSYLDPTCGSGTFLNRLYSRIRWRSAYGKKHSEILSQLWGIDIAHFPAELATINLFRQSVSDYSNFPRVVVKDIFEINPGDEFEFPPPKANPDNFIPVKEKFPFFKGIVGNFPYIRQELIEKKVKGYKKFLTEVIACDWLEEYPEAFEIKLAESRELNHLANLPPGRKRDLTAEWVDKGRIQLKLSKQADIYAYMFFHVAKFLVKEGRMGIVTSNSWLDVAYGYYLKKFFLEKMKLIAIVGSWVEPWFEDASVNTIFTIIENSEPGDSHKVKFVKLKKKLKELIPYQDLKLQENERWRRVDALVSRIENAGPHLLRKNKSAKYERITPYMEVYEDDEMIIRIVDADYLRKELEDKKEMAKWGKYLRAPNVYFEILEILKGKLVPLEDISIVKRGYTTGINEFFYLEVLKHDKNKSVFEVKNAKGWTGEIEEEFLKPVIKSPKESDTIVIDPCKLKYRIFICPYSKSELKQLGKLGALKYIEWGEKQRNKNGVLYKDIPTAKSRKYWWGIEEREKAFAGWLESFGSRFLTVYNEGEVLFDKRFYEIYTDSGKGKLLASLLNSSFIFLQAEVLCRINLGDGALDTTVYEVEKLLIPDTTLISRDKEQKIIDAFDKVKSRPVKSIFEEVKMKDREALDRAVLEAVGLAPDVYLPQIYEALVNLVKERLELPKLRRKQKKSRKKKSLEEIKKILIEEFFKTGVKVFPDAFVRNLSAQSCKTISTTGKPLRIGEQFLGRYKIIDEEGNTICEVGSLEEAKYIVYSYKPNTYLIKIPSNIAEMRNTVKRYEKYVNELEEKLMERAFEATFDHKLAARITREILEEFGLRVLG